MEGNKNNKNHNYADPPIKRSDGSWASDNKSKSEVFADYLADIFKPNETESDIIIENESNQYRGRIPLIAQKEVNLGIKFNLMTGKALGYNLLTGEILKQLPKKAVI